MNEILKEIISQIELPTDQLKDQDPEIREIFIEEVKEIIELLEDCLPQWLDNPSNAKLITEIRRAYHTLKGSGRMAGAFCSSELAWAIEEMLNRVLSGSIFLNSDVQHLVFSVATLYQQYLIADFEQGIKHQVDLRPWIATAQRLSNASTVEDVLAYTICYYQTKIIPMSDDDSDIDVLEQESMASVEGNKTSAEIDELERQTLEIFIEESGEHLQTISEFLHLKEEPSVDEFNQLIRAIHTIRGSSGMMGIDAIFTASSNIENVFKHLDQDNYEVLISEQQLLLDYYEYIKKYVDVLSTNYQVDQLANLNQKFDTLWAIYQENSELSESSGFVQGHIERLLELGVDDLLDAEFTFVEEVQKDDQSYLNILIEQAKLLLENTTARQTEVLNQVTKYLNQAYQLLLDTPHLVAHEDILQKIQGLHQYLLDAFDGLASGQSVSIIHLMQAEFEELIKAASLIPEEVEVEEILVPPSVDIGEETSSSTEDMPTITYTSQPANTEFDKDLLSIFLQEFNELNSNMNTDFNAWTQNLENTEALNKLVHYSHTLKGGANMIQATHLGAVAHELENIYGGVAKAEIQPNEQVLQLIHLAQDNITLRLERLQIASIDEDSPELIAKLQHISGSAKESMDAVVGYPDVEVSNKAVLSEPEVETVEEPVPDKDVVESGSIESVEPAILDNKLANTEFDHDLLSIFLEESEELVTGMDTDFNTWEQDLDNTKVLNNLFRYLHTLKGGANMIQATHLGVIAHELESIYDRVLKGQIQPNTQTLKMIRYAQDDIAVRLDRLRNESIDEDNPELIVNLQRITTGEEVADHAEMIESPSDDCVDEILRVVPSQQEPIFTEMAFAEPQQQVKDSEVALDDALHSPALDTESTVDSQPQIFTKKTANIEFDSDLLSIFLEESKELVAGMDVDFNIWEQDLDNTHVLNNLLRYLHTLKGGANMVQATYLGGIAHELESIYERVLKGQIQPNAQALQMVRYAQDDIAIRLDRLHRESIDEDNPELIANLQRIAAGEEIITSGNQVIDDQIAVIEPVEQDMQGEAEYLSSVQQAATFGLEDLVDEQVYTDEVEDTTEEIEDTIEEVVEDNLLDVPMYTQALASGDEEKAIIVESYLEEARQLLAQAKSNFEHWKNDRSNRSVLLTLQRTFHTIKGNSRVVNEQDIARIAYKLEYTFEQFSVNQFSSERYDHLLEQAQQWVEHAIFHGQFEGIEELFVRLQAIKYEDRLLPHGSEENIDFEFSTEEQFVKGDGSTPPPMYVEVDEQKSKQQTQEQIRVSADLVEKMVDLAGESAINRSRIELDLAQISHTLSEMELAIIRLADQLRRMEGELESQILAKHEISGHRYEAFDPLEMDQYSALNQLSKSLAESASDLIDFKLTLTDKIRDTESLLLQQSRIQNELQQKLMGTRLVPFVQLLPRLQRLVRQISTQLNRPVEFKVENTEGELDRNILERLVSPFEHMLRNGIDHGIEDQETRTSLGKPAVGQIKLNIAREGNDILIIFFDDGRGINVDAVRAKAQQNGLITEDMQLSDIDVMQYIFHPGLSTAEKVTQISGRGVGLDVVRSEIKALGGEVTVNSILGVGTEFTIRVPTSVAISDALMVKVGDQQFALPLAQIERIVRVSPVVLEEYYQSNKEEFELDHVHYRLRYIGEFVNGQASPALKNHGSSVPVIIYSSGGRSVALQVDQLVGSRAQIVIKSVGPQMASIGAVGGATILADGRVCLILDGQTIARRILATARPHQVEQIVQQPTEVRSSRKTIMIVDDSVTVRKVTSRLLERHGFEVITAKDGLDAVERLAQVTPDLMLLDIEMPRMDGFEVTTYVRHDSKYRDLPIIMITSRTGEKHREHAFSLGVNRYMGKPFQEADLLENIQVILSSANVE